MNSSNVEALTAEFQRTWPEDWKNDRKISEALAVFVDHLREGKPSVLPYVSIKNSSILWAIPASTLRQVRDYFEDSRAWLQSADVRNVTGEIVQSHTATTEIAGLLSKVSPEGYGRWTSSIDRYRAVILRLAQMQRFLDTKPDNTRITVPTLPSLRLAFITALSVGDWERAESCIDEIDRWNLDQASNTLHMRIRLLEAQGAIRELFDLACHQNAWDFSSPRRIAGAILNSIDSVVIFPKEQLDGVSAGFSLFMDHWYGKLYQLVEDARDEPRVARILAMAAAVDIDDVRLQRWFPEISVDLANFLSNYIRSHEDHNSPQITADAIAPTEAIALTSGSDENSNGEFWTLLLGAVKHGHSILASRLLQRVDDALLSDVDFLALAADGLLEMLSDPEIELNRTANLLRQDAIATLIDAFVSATDFPRLDHLECYLSLLEGMVILNSESMNSNESQLLLGLVGASVHLSSNSVSRCESIVRQWWNNRPVTQRLDWLSAALDTLASVHSRPNSLVDLFIDGLSLAARRGQKFTPAQLRSWATIGLALELSMEDVDAALMDLRPPAGLVADDPLVNAGLHQIAIISLQETSAREAGREIERRSGAKVTIVTSSVADFQARHARNSDLILYVWAATSHATYRSLDNVRERIEYVQGTGSSSILVAAERWVGRHTK